MTAAHGDPIEFYETRTSLPFEPYDHQRAAWAALDRHYLENGRETGIVVVPTGGGKTAIAAHWLLRQHVAKGGRVLWVAHRRGLLWQARQAFRELGFLASPKERLGTAVIASDAAGWSSVSRDHDLVFSSVQSAVQERSLGFIDVMATQSKGGLMVVVDEAHHGAAPSYRRVVGVAREAGARALGLTATPVRMDPKDERRLWQMFESIIYQVEKRELTANGILSTPAFKTVNTKVDFERDFTEAEVQHLRRYGQLASSVLERVASNSARNRMIVEHFGEHREEYGKTIVFACDTTHVTTLVDEFRKAGVDVDSVDYRRTDNRDVMARFATSDSPQVIVNVEMLTEGFDAPRTKTVLIARPSNSEALVSQMVGRALRGPRAGGTETAHLVTFVDTWRNFRVLDAEYAVHAGPAEDLPSRERAAYELVSIPEELVLEAYRLVQSTARGTFEGVYECLPHGWYVWEQEFEDDIRTRRVLVFENQVEGFARLEAVGRGGGLPHGTLTRAQGEALVAEYFGDTPDPRPAWTDVADLVASWNADLEVGSFTFKEKAAFDPADLARRIREEDLGERAREEMLSRIFETNPACRLVYRGRMRDFQEDVSRALLDASPVRTEALPAVLAVVPDRELQGFPDGEAGHSLVEILEVVAQRKLHFPQGAPRIRDISWSRKLLTREWGFCRNEIAEIVINRWLNSPDIPRFVLEALIYHELLHADMPYANHNRDFRERESRFRPSDEAVADAKARGIEPGRAADTWRVLSDQFLDTLEARFQLRADSSSRMTK